MLQQVINALDTNIECNLRYEAVFHARRAGPDDPWTASECMSSCTFSAGYGKRSLSDISRDISRYRAAYAPYVTGIFFDEGISW